MKKITITKINNWQEIPWKEIMIRIRDLQNKIVEATLEKDMRLVYKLQNQLVSSFEGRALAIRKTVINSGGKTPGIDKIS